MGCTMKAEIQELLNEYAAQYARVNGGPYVGKIEYVKGWVRVGVSRFRVNEFREAIMRLKSRPDFTPKVDVSGEVAELVKLANRPFDPINWRQRDEEFFGKLEALDKKAGKGLAVGKHLRFQVADGYAYYVVTDIGPTCCKVEHLPVHDGYSSECICDGFVMTALAERNIARREGMEELFSKHSKQ